jgi:hypothetical protein
MLSRIQYAGAAPIAAVLTAVPMNVLAAVVEELLPGAPMEIRNRRKSTEHAEPEASDGGISLGRAPPMTAAAAARLLGRGCDSLLVAAGEYSPIDLLRGLLPLLRPVRRAPSRLLNRWRFCGPATVF